MRAVRLTALAILVAFPVVQLVPSVRAAPAAAGLLPGRYEVVEHWAEGKRVPPAGPFKESIYVFDSPPPQRYFWYDTYSVLEVSGDGYVFVRCLGALAGGDDWTGPYTTGSTPDMVLIRTIDGRGHRLRLVHRGRFTENPVPSSFPFKLPPKCEQRTSGTGRPAASAGGGVQQVAFRQAQVQTQPGGSRWVDGLLLIDYVAERGMSQDQIDRNYDTWFCLVNQGHPELAFVESGNPQAPPQRRLVWIDGTFTINVRLGATYDWTATVPDFCGGPSTTRGAPSLVAGHPADPPDQVVKVSLLCLVVERGLKDCRANWLRRP